MIHLYLAQMEYGPTSFACGSSGENDFFSEVLPSRPVFITVPERVVVKENLSYNLFCSGIGIMSGLYQELLGFVLGKHGQFSALGSEGAIFSEFAHYLWYVDLVLATQPMGHPPDQFVL